MTVVSDSSPLISLSRIGRFDFLEKCYTGIWIPEAVRSEVGAEEEMRPGADEVRGSPWIEEKTVVDRELVARLVQRKIGVGEAEAIALAVETGADLLLIDDDVPRRIASELGLPLGGTVGTLIRAKKLGLLALIRPDLTRLRDEAGFHMSKKFFQAALEAAGE